MALLQNEKTISFADVRTGQVLKIIYEGSESLILVVDPTATTVVDTSQGRVGKLHAIKLKSLTEYDMFQLIKFIRSLKTANPRLIYDEFKLTPYSESRRNYRTYSPEKITKISRVTIGQVSNGTSKVIVGNSILYGVHHGNYVTVSIEDYPRIIREIKNCGYQIFYEGVVGVESDPAVVELFNILYAFDDTFDKSQLIYESWEDPNYNAQSGADELHTILPLFGPAFDEAGEGIFPNVQRKLVNKTLSGNETLLQVLLMTDGTGGWIDAASAINITKIISMARPDTQTELNGYLNRPYTKENFAKFHEIGQKYAFADYEDDLGKYYKTADITRLQIAANKIRDQRLFDLMKTRKGVYFAGYGHLEMVEKIKRKNNS